MIKSFSFRRRTLIGFMAIFICTYAVMTCIYMYIQVQESEQRLLRKIENLSTLLVNSSKVGLFLEKEALVRDVVGSLMIDKDVIAVSLVSAHGKVLFDVSSINKYRFWNKGEPVSSKGKFIESEEIIEVLEPVYIDVNLSPSFEFEASRKAQESVGVARIVFSKNTVAGKKRQIFFVSTLLFCSIVSLSFLVMYFSANRFFRPLTNLIERIEKIGKRGEIGALLPIESKDEIGHLAQAFNVMSGNIAQRDKEKDALLRDLHDGLGTMIAGMKRILKDNADNPQRRESDKVMAILSGKVDEASDELNTFMKSVDCVFTDWSVFVGELKRLCDDFCEAHELSCKVTSTVASDVEEALQGLFCFNVTKMVREILMNILKHSQANNVKVDINVEHGVFSMTIEDNGVGFDMETVILGRGLSSIRKRVESLKGEVSIESKSGSGTVINIRIPIGGN